MTPTPYPVTVNGTLDEPLSKGLWLIKWLLAIPHFIVLAVLWTVAVILTIIAMVAIVINGKYPRGIFDFNLGVLRWTWRVQYYTYSALATDKYPPFSFDAPGYPCTLDVPYPEELSRGLALVKWWLLAIPHYIVLGFLVGGSGPRVGGVSFALAIIAGVVLLFTGRYPREVFELQLGINRWALRVSAYTMLMRDEYPPFRLSD